MAPREVDAAFCRGRNRSKFRPSPRASEVEEHFLIMDLLGWTLNAIAEVDVGGIARLPDQSKLMIFTSPSLVTKTFGSRRSPWTKPLACKVSIAIRSFSVKSWSLRGASGYFPTMISTTTTYVPTLSTFSQYHKFGASEASTRIL